MFYVGFVFIIIDWLKLPFHFFILVLKLRRYNCHVIEGQEV